MMRTLHHEWEFEANSPIYADLWCADIDGDGKEEILALTNEDYLHVLSSEGTLRWTAAMEQKSALESMFLDNDSIRLHRSSPISFDIDGDGRQEIIVGSRNKSIYCFDADGKKRWEFMTKGQVNSAASIIDIDGRKAAIIGSDDGFIYALAPDGSLIWKQEIGYPISSKIRSLRLNGNTYVAFGAKDNHVHVLGSDGSKRWNFETGGVISGAPAMGDLGSGRKSIIVGSSDSYVYSLDLQGNLNWKFKTDGAITSDITLSRLRENKMDILLGICSMEKNLLILSENTRIVDSFNAGFWIASAPLVSTSPEGQKRIVFGSYDFNLYVLAYEQDGITNSILKYDTGGVIVSQPAIGSNGKIYAANKKGKVVCIREE